MRGRGAAGAVSTLSGVYSYYSIVQAAYQIHQIHASRMPCLRNIPSRRARPQLPRSYPVPVF